MGMPVRWRAWVGLFRWNRRIWLAAKAAACVSCPPVQLQRGRGGGILSFQWGFFVRAVRVTESEPDAGARGTEDAATATRQPPRPSLPSRQPKHSPREPPRGPAQPAKSLATAHVASSPQSPTSLSYTDKAPHLVLLRPTPRRRTPNPNPSPRLPPWRPPPTTARTACRRRCRRTRPTRTTPTTCRTP